MATHDNWFDDDRFGIWIYFLDDDFVSGDENVNGKNTSLAHLSLNKEDIS